MVSGYPTSTSIPLVDGLSTRLPGFGASQLCGNLYRLELSALPYVFSTLYVNTVSSKKRLRLNEKSFTLGHKHLGHISRQIMKRLITDEIIPDLDLSVFDT